MAGTSGDDHADRGSAGASSTADASDPLGDRRIGDVSESGITQPRLARASVAPDAAGLADAGDDAAADPVTDPYATDPFADPVHRDAPGDATADPPGDPIPGDAGDERAEAYQLALRGLQRRVAAAEAQEPVLRGQLADLQRRLAEAEARHSDASSRRRFALAVAIAFTAGLIVMFAVSRLMGDRSAASGRGAPAAAGPAMPAPIVTPIDLPAAAPVPRSEVAPRDAGAPVDPFAGH